MKIGYIVSTFPKASETFVFREVIALRGMGVDIKVFGCSKPSEEDQSKFSKNLLELGAATTYLYPKQSLQALISNPGKVFTIAAEAYKLKKAANNSPSYFLIMGRAIMLAKRLKKAGINHLHAHWPYATIVGYLAARLAGVSFSVSIHAHEVAHENGHFPVVLKYAKFASFCNQAAMEYLHKQLGDTDNFKSKFHLIYHGVNIEQFPYFPMNLPSKGEVLNIFSAGRVTATKGFDRLILACAKAKKEGINIKLTILGKGSEEEKIRTIAKENDFVENLNMPGWVNHEQVQQYIAESHLFALLADTSYHDGIPNVVLESMASGRPVIISPLPAIAEAITDGEDGFVLKSADDIDGFVAKLKLIFNDVAILQTISKAARKRIEEEHMDKIHIKRMKALFDKTQSVKYLPYLQ